MYMNFPNLNEVANCTSNHAQIKVTLVTPGFRLQYNALNNNESIVYMRIAHNPCS